MKIHILNLRPLRSGGNGDLKIGERSDNHQPVVVKYLREYRQPHAKTAFSREVSLLQRGHRGVVQILGADLNAEAPYYVMPYLSGGSLAKYVGILNDAQLFAVAAELAQTLAVIHASSDTHGDFKPDNILVSGDGQLQVADPLGKGSMLTLLFSRNRGGTPGYMAPEIAAGGAISCSGDVFAFGATIDHLLTGIRPAQGQPFRSLSGHSVVHSPVREKLREVVAACTVADPTARATMRDVIQVLRGEQWKNIVAARQKVQEFVAFGLLIFVGVAIVASATKS